MRNPMIWAIGFAVVIYVLNWLLPKTNTKLGGILRESDHDAWQFAIEEREEELAELRRHEPRR